MAQRTELPFAQERGKALKRGLAVAGAGLFLLAILAACDVIPPAPHDSNPIFVPIGDR